VAGGSRDSWFDHWREYLAEAVGLGLFLLGVGSFATLLHYPGSPLHQALPWPLLRRAVVGLFVGLSVVAIVYSPLGRRSGAHLNPAVTLTFFRLGKVHGRDAIFYVLAQFTGGALALTLLAAILGPTFSAEPVLALVTRPGARGAAVAFVAELVMAFGMMLLVLVATNRKSLARVTGVLAGALAATYIVVAAPLSGMSINPARSFASALAAQFFHLLWIYFTAPPLGMLLAADLYRRWLSHGRPAICAKLDHTDRYHCIFKCGYRAGMRPM
jgi:aquaporin Z